MHVNLAGNRKTVYACAVDNILITDWIIMYYTLKFSLKLKTYVIIYN